MVNLGCGTKAFGGGDMWVGGISRVEECKNIAYIAMIPCHLQTTICFAM